MKIIVFIDNQKLCKLLILFITRGYEKSKAI